MSDLSFCFLWLKQTYRFSTWKVPSRHNLALKCSFSCFREVGDINPLPALWAGVDKSLLWFLCCSLTVHHARYLNCKSHTALEQLKHVYGYWYLHPKNNIWSDLTNKHNSQGNILWQFLVFSWKDLTIFKMKLEAKFYLTIFSPLWTYWNCLYLFPV